MRIASGEDISHLGELDEKYWTVLSCPVAGLEMDARTLGYIDADGDGVIRSHEVVATAEWLCSALGDRDLIVKGGTELPLDKFDSSTPLGERLLASARQILGNLGLEKDSISLADASDSVAIFKTTGFNGDGVITRLSTSDEALQGLIGTIADKMGAAADRSGEPGVDEARIEAFYAACADYAAWCKAKPELPYGDKTADALAACEALKAKVADYFTRCRLLCYDAEAAAAVEIPLAKIEDLSACTVAKTDVSGVLNLDKLNPAWQAAFDRLIALAGAEAVATKEGVTETSWNAFCASFEPYSAWMAAKKGEAVEGLGLEAVQAVLEADRKQELLDIVAADKALEAESSSIDDVKKLMYLLRDFYTFLCNYVIMSDFYDRDSGRRAVFEAGRLFIDQRCCELCIKVTNMGAHADMASQSGMFLIYCNCKDKKSGASMDIAALLTAGQISDLRPGKNGIFYDRSGKDWDATITKVVDNPINIKNAFWSPYRKAAEYVSGLINKSAAEKESKSMAGLQTTVSGAVSDPTAAAAGSKTTSFDIAKFAGIFAAIGIALGAIGTALTALVSGAAAHPLTAVIVIVVIMLIISGPSCFIAWSKLRRRNLGPVLNANGWAVNSKVLVNMMFGEKLTSVAKYPKLKLEDPYVKKKHCGRNWAIAIIVILILAFLALWFFGVLEPLIGLSAPGFMGSKEAVDATQAVEEAATEVL